jgi:60 kDa SS-A/Ro ribonucleoprotein
MSTYLKNVAAGIGSPLQTEPLNERQVKNSSGGYSFPVTDWVRLERFLILGSESGSYYATEKKLTAENAKAVQNCIKEDGERVVKTVVEVSEVGRAAKNDPALFVLALCAAAKNEKTRAAALNALSKVARIGTHLFHFVAYVDSLRGWGRGLRSAVANWYMEKDMNQLQNQLVKYQSRDGWSHRDLLRLSHPKALGDKDAALRWAVKGYEELKTVPDSLGLISAFELAQANKDNGGVLAGLIRSYQLTREMLPTEALKSKAVWEALLEKMPMTAMVRNLANMTRVGLLEPMSDAAKEISKRLTNQEALRKARAHPIQILTALLTYQAGRGQRSQGEGWKPVQTVVDALDEAFYLSFANVEPTGKRWYIGLDVSGSMNAGEVSGVLGLTPLVASSAMAMVTARTESEHVIRAFSGATTGRRIGKKATKSMHYGYDVAMVPVDISPKQRLDDVCRKTDGLPFGGTDCALPMLDALEDKLKVDVFCVLTDSETWAGDIHPTKALEMYRNQMGIPAKLIVVGMVSNGFSIADPDDGGMLDVCGFDTNAPAVMADFARQ